jgi:hypothetical protein
MGQAEILIDREQFFNAVSRPTQHLLWHGAVLLTVTTSRGRRLRDRIWGWGWALQQHLGPIQLSV